MARTYLTIRHAIIYTSAEEASIMTNKRMTVNLC